METNNNNGQRDRDDSQSQYRDHRDGSEEVSHIGATDRDVSGNDITEENRDERRHHQQFGNRKYESNKNHSSADDQPRVNTGPEFS